MLSGIPQSVGIFEDIAMVIEINRKTNKATWKAAYRYMRLSRNERFMNPVGELVRKTADECFKLRFQVVDYLSYCERFNLNSMQRA